MFFTVALASLLLVFSQELLIMSFTSTKEEKVQLALFFTEKMEFALVM